jgi:hypothetical protein
MPLDEWLPARYLASFTWPVPAQRVERRGDGIAYYNKSRAVDVPFIATLSTDSEWVIASFARELGNVWSNPELTCRHVDPQNVALAGTARYAGGEDTRPPWLAGRRSAAGNPATRIVEVARADHAEEAEHAEPISTPKAAKVAEYQKHSADSAPSAFDPSRRAPSSEMRHDPWHL